MAAVPRRAERLRKVAWKLTEQYGLPRGREVTAELDPYSRPKVWVIEWRDGPTEAQLRRAAAKLDKEVLEGVGFRREYSDQAYAAAAIRFLRDGEPIQDEYRPDVNVYQVRRLLDSMKNPGPRDARERFMSAVLVKNAERQSSVFGDGDAICREATQEGLACLLWDKGAYSSLSPIEMLTERYATGRASALWRYRLIPMTAPEAFAAVQADYQASPEQIAAALSLLPQLHAALDTAAASLQERLSP
ncbi:hypothetical protein ACFUJY_29530 [Streptomyces sp. NPDC057249]|uniref:hypothetical protein n=1 Tax=Streptomyces sp. NPDC057249 TaxID=3346067 RepID=UPI0036267A64